MNDPVISFENVSKFYKLYDSPKDRLKEALNPWGKKYHREFYALRHISLKIQKGEIVGIIGRNGSGKSTLLKIVSGVIPANSGKVIVNGAVSALLELGAGLNPAFTGVQNILFGGVMMGFSREEMEGKLDDIIAFAGIGQFIHQPLKTYSSGMKARLGFALAINVSPEILIVDEVLAVGDDLFRRKCYDKMTELMKSGCTVLFVSHNTQTVDQLCSRSILLDGGELILDGPSPFVSRYYQKLLYTSADQYHAFRDEIIRLNDNAEEKTNYISRDAAASPTPAPPPKTEERARPKPYFIPNYLPATTVTHSFADVHIQNTEIRSATKEKVNVLVMNDDYRLHYDVIFNQPAKQVKFATLIQGDKGLNISGITLEPETPTDASSGDIFHIEMGFQCLLLPGIYYISISVNGADENGDKLRLLGVHDISVFNVVEDQKHSLWGVVHLRQTSRITRTRKGNRP